MNINDLYSAAQEASDNEFGEDTYVTPEDAPDGTSLAAEIVYAGTRTSNAGNTSINAKLQVTEGDHKGKVFWNSVGFSQKKTDGAARYNKAQFGKLEAAGITSQFLSNNPSMEAIAKGIEGKKVTVKMHWDEPGDDGRSYTSRFMPWYPVSDAPGGYVPGKAPQGF